MTVGRRLVTWMVLLAVADVIGGFIAVATGVNTWGEAWGFDAKGTVPLPVAAVQLLLAWVAMRNTRPRVSLAAAWILGAFCLMSLLSGLFDGDLIGNVTSNGFASWSVLWAIVLLVATAVVGWLAFARGAQIRRLN